MLYPPIMMKRVIKKHTPDGLISQDIDLLIYLVESGRHEFKNNELIELNLFSDIHYRTKRLFNVGYLTRSKPDNRYFTKYNYAITNKAKLLINKISRDLAVYYKSVK